MAGCVKFYRTQGFSPSALNLYSQEYEKARRLLPEGTFYNISVYDDPDVIIEDDFDIAISLEVVEHLYQPGALFQFASRKLITNGVCIVTTPYHGYLKNLSIALCNQWDHHHRPNLDGGHIKFWSISTLSKLAADNGFDVLDVRGTGRLPYLWKSMVLVARKSG